FSFVSISSILLSLLSQRERVTISLGASFSPLRERLPCCSLVQFPFFITISRYLCIKQYDISSYSRWSGGWRLPMLLPQVVFSSYYSYHLLSLEEVFDVFGCLPCRLR